MKKLIFTLVILIGILSACSEKEPPPPPPPPPPPSEEGIVFPEMSEKVINDLELLGKLWGFLKYHHPKIAKGQYNWDNELFVFLPQYLKVEDNEQRDKLLFEWIGKYGEIPVCTNCQPTAADAVLKPDFSWVDNGNMSQQLKAKINEIYSNRHQGDKYYVSKASGVGNPEFKNENRYSNMPYPDAEYRLLSLYRLWNMVQYYFPNRHLTDKNWNSVLREYIPIFISASNELEYELAALRIIGEINDTHANLWGGGNKIADSRGYRYPPFRAEFIEDKLVVTDYYNPEFADAAELKVGDIITHISGELVEAKVESLRPYYPASNDAAMRRDIAVDLMRSNQASINVSYISEGQSKQKSVPLYAYSTLNMYGWSKNNENPCYKFLDDNIGYITLGTIKDADISVIKNLFIDTKGIVIDIRNYPATYVIYSLGSYFVSGSAPFVKISEVNINNPGEINFTRTNAISATSPSYRGKLVVLVNEYSQSQAEYTAMAFRAGASTTIVGSTTAGADGNVSEIYLPGGLMTYISGIGVYYPNGTETQRVGIIPDIWVRPTIEGIKNGKDEVLEAAIDIIKN